MNELMRTKEGSWYTTESWVVLFEHYPALPIPILYDVTAGFGPWAWWVDMEDADASQALEPATMSGTKQGTMEGLSSTKGTSSTRSQKGKEVV